VTLHAPAFAVSRIGLYPSSDGAVDRPCDRWRHRNGHHRGPLAEDADDAVPVLLAQVVDV
jgi:hypothetical protein